VKSLEFLDEEPARSYNSDVDDDMMKEL